MKKIAIVISSFSGMLKTEVEMEEFYLLPLQIIINNQEKLEGYYSLEEKYGIVNDFNNSDIFSTSLPPIGLIETQMEELAKNYNDVLYLPIDSQLSSTYNVLLSSAKQYKNVHVFDNKFNGSVMLRIARKIKEMYENENKSMDEILEYLKWFNDHSIGYIVPKELKTFIKSGRLKGIKKAILKSMNLSIIVEVGETLKSIGVSRTKKLATHKIINRIVEFIESKNMKIKDFDFSVIWAFDQTIVNIFETELYNELKVKPTYREESSIVTMMHTGFGAGYIGINPKIK